MKVIRKLVNSYLVPFKFGIDQDGGGNAGAPSDVPADSPSIEQTITSALAGDSIEPDALPDPNITTVADESENTAIKPDSNESGKPNTEVSQVDNFMWEQLQKKLSTEDEQWEIPEAIKTGKKEDGTDLTPEERYEMFVENAVKTVQKTENPEQDDFMKAYQVAKQDKDFNMQEFLKQEEQKNAIFSSDDNTFLQAYLKSQKTEEGKQKHSDQEINDYINKLNSIEKTEKVTALKNELKKSQQLRVQQQEEAIQAKQKEAFDSWESNRQKLVKSTIERMSSIEDIAGIPITESDIKEFQPVFDKMTQFNPKTNQLFMDDYLQSNNENVFKMLYLLNKADSGEINKYISGVKQSTKDDILNKTGIKPNVQGSSTASRGNSKVPESTDFH